jgi:hypothetical protein
MPADPFASIYGDLNWDAPRGPRRCEECGLGEPVAGAYPSALFGRPGIRAEPMSLTGIRLLGLPDGSKGGEVLEFVVA